MRSPIQPNAVTNKHLMSRVPRRSRAVRAQANRRTDYRLLRQDSILSCAAISACQLELVATEPLATPKARV